MAEMIKFKDSDGKVKYVGNYGSIFKPLPTTGSGGGGGGSSTPTTIYNNHVNVSTAGTRVQLTSTSTTIQRVTIKANEDNVGNIFVGNSNVDSSNGIVISAGESVDIMIDNLNKVYIDSETDGDGISYVGG